MDYTALGWDLQWLRGRHITFCSFYLKDNEFQQKQGEVIGTNFLNRLGLNQQSSSITARGAKPSPAPHPLRLSYPQKDLLKYMAIAFLLLPQSLTNLWNETCYNSFHQEDEISSQTGSSA